MGVKYLGFFLKLNNYRQKDWVWLLEKKREEANDVESQVVVQSR